MKKLTILTCTMIALGFMAITVRAQSPHYITGPDASLDDNNYCVAFKEAGLGSGGVQVTYTVTADATFTFQCFTKKGNMPQGEPNSVSFSGLTGQTTLTAHNGQITGEVCLVPQGAGRCRGKGLVNRLVGACYQNVTFSDTATGDTFDMPTLFSGVGCPP
jgi:hypothetical protein